MQVTLACEGERNKAHKTIMASDSSVIETIFMEIDIIKEEQSKIIEYHAFLEDRRQRLVNFIQKTDDIKLSEKAVENLVNCVSKLEIKVMEDPEKETVASKVTRKCRHNNRGYCKHQNRCRFYHCEEICEQFVKDGSCEVGKVCPYRHPKDCKYTEGPQGCKRGEYCKYLHKNDKEADCLTIQKDGKERKDDQKLNEDIEVVSHSEELILLQHEVIEKESKIKELEEIQLDLNQEIKNLKGHVERLERVATNMHKELKNKK